MKLTYKLKQLLLLQNNAFKAEFDSRNEFFFRNNEKKEEEDVKEMVLINLLSPLAQKAINHHLY